MVVDSSSGVEYRSPAKKAKAYSNSTTGLKDMGKMLAQSLLEDAEGRAADCPGAVVAPAPAPAPPPAVSVSQPAPVPEPAPPTEIELSVVAILLDELPKDPQRLVSMRASGALTREELQVLESRWRERAETLEFQSSIINEDRDGIAKRIKRIAHPATLTELPPRRTRHFISNVVASSLGGAEILVTSNQLVYAVRLGAQAQYPGSWEHTLRRVGDQLQISQKKVFLLSSDRALAQLPVL